MKQLTAREWAHTWAQEYIKAGESLNGNSGVETHPLPSDSLFSEWVSGLTPLESMALLLALEDAYAFDLHLEHVPPTKPPWKATPECEDEFLKAKLEIRRLISSVLLDQLDRPNH